MTKATKEDYEKIFNEILGLDVNWSKLPLEDLKALSVIFANPEVIVKRLGYQTEKEKRREKTLAKLEEIVVKKIDEGSGPLAKLAKRALYGKDSE